MVKHLKPWIWQSSDWPVFTWDASALSPALATARRAQGKVAGTARLLSRESDSNAQLEVLTHEGVATSAIEGEQFNRDSLRSSLARRLGLHTGSSPPSTRFVEGLADVLLAATREYAQPLTLAQLSRWQAALFPTGRSGLHEIRVGDLRGDAPMQIVSGPVGRTRVHYEAPPRDRLEAEMDAFLQWFNAPPDDLDGLVRAGLAHAWFEIIHPFEDGNGRIGRALLDRALAQDEGRAVRLYSMSARFESVRNDYYDALGDISRGTMDATSWLRWFLEQVEVAATSSQEIIRHVLTKARFWVDHAQQQMNDRQRKVLNAMLDAGPGGFVGGMTNRKYASLTRTSPATAQRDLAELVSNGSLVLEGSGRSVRYRLSPAPGAA